MKKYTFIIIILIGFIQQVMAQKSALSGKITDRDNKPIVGANVILKGTVRAVQTNEPFASPLR